MKINVSSSDLQEQLDKAFGAIVSNPVVHILEDFLFTVKDNTLTITATDLETSIITELEVQAEEEGTMAIPAKILIDTLKALPEQPISLELDEENQSIELTSQYGKYHLAAHDPEDYPEIPEDEDADSFEMEGPALEEALQHTLFATSTDELRLAMTGLYMQVDFDKTIFVATDAHKLVRYTCEDVASDLNHSLILPKKSMNILKGILPDEEEVEISYTSRNAFFKFKNSRLICRLIDAKYPDYNAVIPDNNENILHVNREEFYQSLKRASIYANKTTNQVELQLQDSSLTLSAKDLDFSNDATEQLACQYEGETMTIGFNAKFLMEMLQALDSDEVQVRLDTPSRAGLLIPSEKKENVDILMLVMPVVLNY